MKKARTYYFELWKCDNEFIIIDPKNPRVHIVTNIIVIFFNFATAILNYQNLITDSLSATPKIFEDIFIPILSYLFLAIAILNLPF